MAENRTPHRLARAAGRAARAFQENQAADDARIRAERERLAAQEARPADPAEPARPTATAVVGEAARRAASDFQERQREDDARLRGERARVRAEDEARLAERREARERALDERDAAEAGLVHPLLRLARGWWTLITVLLAALAGACVWNGLRAQAAGGEVVDPLTGVRSIGPLGGPTGQFVMAGMAGVLALVALWGLIGLLRRRRAAVGTLTFLAALIAVPAFLRGNALLILLAVVLLVGAALLWLPPVRSRLRR